LKNAEKHLQFIGRNGGPPYLDKFENGIVPYKDINYEVYSLFVLSLVNCAIGAKENKIFPKFEHYPFNGPNIAIIINSCVNWVGSIFSEEYMGQKIPHDDEITNFHNTLSYWAFYQHINELLKYKYPKGISAYPTLLLDWTEDYSIASSKFGSRVVSIDYAKYQEYMKEWFVFYKNNVLKLPQRKQWLGCTTYLDEQNQENYFMQDQKGYCIFWPWKFMIEDLADHNKNEIGRAFDFRIEQ
jgi:hypothetical protein